MLCVELMVSNDLRKAASKAADEAEKALMDILPVGDVFNALVSSSKTS